MLACFIKQYLKHSTTLRSEMTVLTANANCFDIIKLTDRLHRTNHFNQLAILEKLNHCSCTKIDFCFQMPKSGAF